MNSIIIKNGWVIDPAQKINSIQDILIQNERIADIGRIESPADHEIDATGQIVCPGFVDIHMHEESFLPAEDRFATSIFECMLRMGVTTAIGGNCGTGPLNPADYLECVDRLGLPINFGIQVPHESLRSQLGADDKYRPMNTEDILGMKKLALGYLDQGCLGISLGIRYVPGATPAEWRALSEAAAEKHALLSAHIRDDADAVYSSTDEFIQLAKTSGCSIQVSHIGSMAGFGQMQSWLEHYDRYRLSGLDIGADCYPYQAFSTGIGETTYDEGFLERYKIDYSAIEIAEGPHRGERCNEQLFYRLRQTEPELITIAHVMKKEDIDLALTHPAVLLASDGFMRNYQGHPRAAGTFPRFLHNYAVEKSKLSLSEAIAKMTWLPAQRFGLDSGTLIKGRQADIVIFNREQLCDRATFAEPALPPEGIRYVIINGQIAIENQKIITLRAGNAIRW